MGESWIGLTGRKGVKGKKLGEKTGWELEGKQLDLKLYYT